MSDHIARAAQVIVSVLRNAIEDFDVEEDVDASLVDAITQALDAAGLLASPTHDAAVAARALRDAAKDTLYGHDAVGLRRRADWVESEGGASDG